MISSGSGQPTKTVTAGLFQVLCAALLLGAVAVLGGLPLPAAAAFAEPDGHLAPQLHYCPSGVGVDTPGVIERCDRSSRPADQAQRLDNAAQLIRLTLTNASDQIQPTRLFIGPYYLGHIQIYGAGDARGGGRGGLQPLASGGADQGGGTASAALAGHAFALNLPPGRSAYLLRIEAPGFAHLSVKAEPLRDVALASDGATLSVGLHLGMLAVLAGLALVPVLLHPGPVSRRLFALNALILMQVGLGSGLIPQLIPALPGPAAMSAFMVLIMVRTAVWGGLYQALIQPHFPARGYQWACWLSYATAGLAAVLYLLEWVVAARVISLVLVLAIPVLHTVAALRARTLMPLLKRALVGSLIIYDGLQVVAIVLLIGYSGQSDMPVIISRFLDLAVPLLAMGTVLLRNRASDQQLAHAKQTLARQEARIAAEMAASEEKRTLLDMLTHEIRNPLATIKLASRALQAQASATPALRRRAANIDTGVRTIDAVIERCDLHNRIEGEGITPQQRPVDIERLLDDLVLGDALAPRLDREGPALGRVMTDSYLLQILLGNLLDNATKYSPADTRIQVVRERSADAWHLGVRNRIDPDWTPDPERLFERYYRHERARHKGGSGLGLPLAKRIAERLGGMLDYRHDGDEVQFTVHMPDHPGQAA